MLQILQIRHQIDNSQQTENITQKDENSGLDKAVLQKLVTTLT